MAAAALRALRGHGLRRFAGAGRVAGRALATYAENPVRWQADPAVQMYGQLLAVRDTQQDAFLVAAETLRAQADLPKDLRASAGRTRATVLFQRAVSKAEGLIIGLEAPWPREAFDAAVAAASAACDAYAAAVAESSDPALCEEVAPHCPEWAEAVNAVRHAHFQVLKLRAELRLRQVRWHARQAEHSRTLNQAAAKKASADAASIAAEALEQAGLPATAEERDLWQGAVDAAEALAEGCPDVGEADVAAFRQRGLGLQVVLLKDLAVACAMSHDLERAVLAMLRSLRLPVQQRFAVDAAAREQAEAAADGVMELCRRRLETAETQGGAEAAAAWAAELSVAIAAFRANR